MQEIVSGDLQPSGELAEEELATVFAGNWAETWWNDGIDDDLQSTTHG